MNLYEYIYNLSYIIISILPLVNPAGNSELQISTRSCYVVPNTVGLQLTADVNNTSLIDDIEVNFVPDKCCVDLDKRLHCDIVKIYGECVDVIPKGKVFVIIIYFMDSGVALYLDIMNYIVEMTCIADIALNSLDCTEGSTVETGFKSF